MRYVETVVRSWAKVMERVLTQFQQLRRENEFVGPVVEIEYWRRQLAKFTSIVEFLKSEPCMRHVQLLQQAKSKFLKVTTQYFKTFYLININYVYRNGTNMIML